MRRAASERARRTLTDRRVAELDDILGAVRSDGGRARQTGEAFTDVLTERRQSG
jgi:hypothetical protein